MEYAEAYGICLNPTLLSPFAPPPPQNLIFNFSFSLIYFLGGMVA